MRFSISTAFLPTDQLVPIAKAADELGYDSLAMPDHVVDLETLRTPYPYTPDGARRWGPDAEWPDPWVMAGALSTVTTRLRFFTSVYVPALRNPFQVAKSVGTAAVISGNRVALGVGIGWCEEEFELLEQSFRTRGQAHRRGARADQGAVAARVARVPRRVLRRTAAGDGADPDRAGPDLRRWPLRDRLRAGGAARRLGRRHVPDRRGDRLGHPAGRGTRRGRAPRATSRCIVALTDAFLPEHFARAEEGGVTDCMTMPWMYYSGRDATVDQKLEGMARFAEDVISPLAG